MLPIRTRGEEHLGKGGTQCTGPRPGCTDWLSWTRLRCGGLNCNRRRTRPGGPAGGPIQDDHSGRGISWRRVRTILLLQHSLLAPGPTPPLPRHPAVPSPGAQLRPEWSPDRCPRSTGWSRRLALFVRKKQHWWVTAWENVAASGPAEAWVSIGCPVSSSMSVRECPRSRNRRRAGCGKTARRFDEGGGEPATP